MSTRSSAPRGVLMAGVGAFVALASLWLPWYTIKLPESFREALGSIGSGGAGSTGAAPGSAGEAFSGLFKGLASVLPNEITGKGWQVMSGGDVGLAIAAGAALLLALAVAGGFSGVRIENSAAGRLIAFAGLVVTAIALYHVVSKPGAGEGGFSTVVTVKIGIWAATAGGLSMIVGGLMTARPPQVAAAELDLSPTFEAPQADVAADPFAAPVPLVEPETMAEVAPDPFASPAREPEAVTFDSPHTAAAPDPLPAPDPYAAPAYEPEVTFDSEVKPDPFAAPDPYAAPAYEPEVTFDSEVKPDPFASPDPFPTPYEPEVTLDSDVRPDPFATPDPFEQPADPFAAPVEAHAAPEPDSAVPDWAGFSTPSPGDEPAPEPEVVASSSAGAEPSVPRPAGVSIPPPGWTGAA